MFNYFLKRKKRRIAQDYMWHTGAIKVLEENGCLVRACEDCDLLIRIDDHLSTCPRTEHVVAKEMLYKRLFNDYHETTYRERDKKIEALLDELS